MNWWTVLPLFMITMDCARMRPDDQANHLAILNVMAQVEAHGLLGLATVQHHDAMSKRVIGSYRPKV